MRRVSFFSTMICLLLGVSGCEEPSASPPPAATSSGGPPPPPLDRPPLKAEDLQPQPESRQEVAAVGAGRKGRGYGGGILTEPLRVRWRAEEKIIFEINIPHAMRLYEALHDKKPESEEVFMSEIIDANEIDLPELPAGQKYVYDVQKGQLMVEIPNTEPAKE